MNKYTNFVLLLVVIFLSSPLSASAYNLSLDVRQNGSVNYSYPAVLGDDTDDDNDEDEDKKEDIEKPERPKVEKPEKIEVRQEDRKIKVEYKKQEKVEQTMTPKRVKLQFSATPSSALRNRLDREDEKVEIQSEIHDDGTVELQIESRTIKAKIKNSEIELDVNNNNIGATDLQGNKIELIHLPDQAMKKFVDLGATTVSETLEVGQSGNSFEYTVDSVKVQKLFGIIPRTTKFKLTLNDSTGTVTEKAIASNLTELILNLFSF